MKSDDRFDRNIGIWDEAFQQKLADTVVSIAGCGGAGGDLALMLAQNGVGRFRVADPDIFEVSNAQRQILANENTYGKNKAEVTAEAIKAINPDAKVEVYPEGVTEDNVNAFVVGSSFVYEVVDYSAPHIKTIIHRTARAERIVSATAGIFGAGTVLIMFHWDREKSMTYEEYFKNPGTDPEHKLDVTTTLGRFPDYMDRDWFVRRVATGRIPTTADGAFLTTLTGGVLKRLLMGKEVAYAPKILRVDVLDDEFYWNYVIDNNRA